MPRLAILSVLFLSLSSRVSAGEESPFLLPDVTARRSDLFDNDIVTTIERGRTHLRVSNGTPNIGVGPLYVYGAETDPGSETQAVIQRIFREDGTFEDFESGQFVFHEAHNHIHIEAWSLYRLRAIVPGVGGGPDTVGDIVAEGDKTSFCLLDLGVHDRSLPNFDPNGRFLTCSSTIQGLSVGWVDVYHKSLAGQNIDITDVPGGEYWLEAVVDPENHFQELDETNNTARVRVTIPGRATLDPDPYEPNASTNDIDGRPQGGPNSPNLGPCNPKRTIEELTIHEGGDVDFFKFYNPGNGGAIDMVRIDFQHSSGDLGLQLLGSNGTLLASSRTSANFEIISLTDRPAGWYYARVFGESSTVTQDSYTLTINPGLSDNPPTIESLAPAEGDLRLPHGIGIYTVRWNSSDEDGDPVWVSVYVNSVPERDGNEELLPTSLHGDGSLGFYIVNSADFAPGTYWFYFRATDGGSVTGAWSEGTVTFIDVEPECTNVGNGGDCDGNGILDSCDLESGIRDDCNGNAIPDVCDIESGLLSDVNRDGKPDNCGIPFHRGDTNVDASIDVSDAVVVLSYLFRGRPVACLESADVDNSGQVNLTDAIGLLNYLFRLGAPPVSPGVPKSGICGRDSDLSGSEGDLGCETYDVCL